MYSPGGGLRPLREGIRDSTGRRESRRTRGRGSGGVEHGEKWEDSLVTRPENENELSQTNRSVRGVSVRVLPVVLSKLSRALHAHCEMNLLQNL